jgi:hypothetical protein
MVKDVSVLREHSKYGTQFSAEVVLPNMPLRGRATSKVPPPRSSRCRAIKCPQQQPGEKFDALTALDVLAVLRFVESG